MAVVRVVTPPLRGRRARRGPAPSVSSCPSCASWPSTLPGLRGPAPFV